MWLARKRYLPAFSLLSGLIVCLFVLWLPQLADSITPSDICPKHNVSSGEYTACFYCHNAETPEENMKVMNKIIKINDVAVLRFMTIPT